MANIITFRAVVFSHQQRIDGSYNVKVRVTFKRASRYISSNITAREKEVTSKGELKGAAKIAANRLIDSFYTYASELNYYSLQVMSVDDVVSYIHKKATSGISFNLDFFDYAINDFIPAKKESNKRTYMTAVNAFRRFLKQDICDINEISKGMLTDFCRFLDREPKINTNAQGAITGRAKKPGLAAHIYASRLNAIYQEARYMYNDEDNGILRIPRNPFERLKIDYVQPIARTALPVERIQQLIDFNGSCTEGQRLALDVYLISFALMGMNAADMLTCAPDKDGIIIYNRQKTRDRRPDKAEHRVKIDARILPLIERHRDPDGLRMFNFYRSYERHDTFDAALRSYLATWASRNHQERFTLYSARHSWATLANSSKVGIDKALVNDCLCHVDAHLKIADVYIQKDWQRMWDANEKVLDLFDWTAVQ